MDLTIHASAWVAIMLPLAFAVLVSMIALAFHS